jgi:hypothetical protein
MAGAQGMPDAFAQLQMQQAQGDMEAANRQAAGETGNEVFDRLLGEEMLDPEGQMQQQPLPPGTPIPGGGMGGFIPGGPGLGGEGGPPVRNDQLPVQQPEQQPVQQPVAPDPKLEQAAEEIRGGAANQPAPGGQGEGRRDQAALALGNPTPAQLPGDAKSFVDEISGLSTTDRLDMGAKLQKLQDYVVLMGLHGDQTGSEVMKLKSNDLAVMHPKDYAAWMEDLQFMFDQGIQTK